MRRRGVSFAHAAGVAAGALIAVLVLLHRAAESPAPEAPVPAQAPAAPAAPAVPGQAPDGWAHAARLGATHFGHGSDGSLVSLWVKPREWRWWIMPPKRGCASGRVDLAARMSTVWGPPRDGGHFSLSTLLTEPIGFDGRRGTLRAHMWIAAHRQASGRVSGTFSRVSVFGAPGVAGVRCEQGLRFELRSI